MNNNYYKLLLLASGTLLAAVGAVAISPPLQMAGNLRNAAAAARQTDAKPVASGIEAPPTEAACVRNASCALSVPEEGIGEMAISAAPVSETVGQTVSIEAPSVKLPEIPDPLPEISVIFGDDSPKAAAPKALAAGKAVAGKFISRDVSAAADTKMSALLTVANTASADTMTIANLYEWGDNAIVKMGVNEAAGTVAIPQQTLENNATYGNIDVVAITITPEGKYSIPTDRTIRGTINEKGEVTLGSWAIVALDEATKKVKATFNIFNKSEWALPNGKFRGTDPQGKQLVAPIYIEQESANEAIVYNMINGMTAVVSARLTPAGKVMVSPQKVVQTTIYGDFYLYGINPANGKPDSSNPIVITPSSDGSMSFTGFYVADQQTLSYVLQAYADVTISGTYNITFPQPTVANFKGSGTSADPWIISSYTDLKALSEKVESGETYEGKHFALGSDLNLLSVGRTDFTPIGSVTFPFRGSFDGKGHTIKGLQIDGKGFSHIGLFGYLGAGSSVKDLILDTFIAVGSGDEIGCLAGRCEGSLTNITVRNSHLQTNGLLTGGICGALLNGSVRNSSFHGRLTGQGSVAGIAGQSSASDITGCTVQGQFVLDGYISTKAHDIGGIAGVFSGGKLSDCMVIGTITDSYGRGSTGGLVGRLLSKSSVSNCMTTASISARRYSSDTSSYAGGLFGVCMSSEVADCMNSGTIIMAGTNDNVGGLTGQIMIAYQTSGNITTMIQQTYFKNCYNSGQIMSSSEEGHKGIYGTAFALEGYPDHPEDVCLSNCFFDQQVNRYESAKFGRNTRAILGKVPEGFSSELWEATSNKYPVLKSFADTYASALASVPVILSDGNDANKVKEMFILGNSSKVEWAVDGELGNTESDAIRLTGNIAYVKDIYDTAIIAAATKDGLGLKLYMLDVVPKVFEGDGTASSPYQLSEPADFVKLNDAISVHKQPHAGDYFVMTRDVDFKGFDQFKGFGFGTQLATKFSGTFDGNGHSIRNLNLDMATYNADGTFDSKCPNGYNGLFNQLGEKATVKNLVIAADCKFDFNIFSGTIVAFNRGRIENCRNYAPVKGHQRQIGGIAGINHSGVIADSYNAGRIECDGSVAGGIAGLNYDSALISGCQNDGDVILTADKANSAGGITSDNYGTVENCLNNGEIIGAEIVGGIAAYTVNSYLAADPVNPLKPITKYCQGIVRKCVNIGQITCTGQTSTRGAIIGQRGSSNEISGNYYDCSINLTGGVQSNDINGISPLSTMELTKGTALAGLSSEIFDFKANAYPVLKKFAGEEASQALRSIFLKLADGQIRTNIRSDVELSQGSNLSWKLTNNAGFAISGAKLTVTPPSGTTVLADTLTASLGGKYTKTYAINSVPIVFAGQGTAEDPYRIENKADWKKLVDFVAASKWEYPSSHFIVTSDIDFGGDSIQPVAYNGVRFQGILDGNGKTFKGFIYDNPNGFENRIDPNNPNKFVGKGTGLFGNIGSVGVVKNLTIDGIIRGHSSIGGFAGYLYGTVENCVNKGTVSTNSSTAVGGIAYRLAEGGVIRNCVNEGTVFADNGSDGGSTHAAGIVYYTEAGTLVEGCVNKGMVGHRLKGFNCGIAITAMGTLRDCRNERLPLGSTNIYGIAYSLGKDAIMENCCNTADFIVPDVTNVYGLFGSAAEKGSGYIKGCYNTGNISGKAAVAGLGNDCYMPMIDCYNTGDVTSELQRAAGIVVILGVEKDNAAKSSEYRNVSYGLYNTGNISGVYAECAGLVGQLKAFATLTDSYNLGDVTQKHNGLGCGGVVATGDGRLERCFNAGDVYSWGHCTGGVMGRPGGDKIDWETGLVDCFNFGNVTVDSKVTSSTVYGAVGGVAGSPTNSDTRIMRCYNAGTVTANDVSGKCAKGVWAGGIIGNVLNPRIVVADCFNAGRVECSDPSTTGGRRSFTVGANDEKFWVKPDSIIFSKSMTNVRYDRNVNSGKANRHIAGSDLSTSELCAAEFDGFVKPEHGGYPVLKAFNADHEASLMASATVQLGNEATESHDNVLSWFKLHAPAGSVWTEIPASGASPCLYVSGNVATPTAIGTTTLKCTGPTGYVRTFKLTVAEGFQNSVETIDGGKVIDRIDYIDMSGLRVATPQPGIVYIVRTYYTDGTINVEKRIYR